MYEWIITVVCRDMGGVEYELQCRVKAADARQARSNGQRECQAPRFAIRRVYAERAGVYVNA